jgi:penicillin-binding protein 2
MNSATSKTLKTVFLATTLIALMITPSTLTTVAAKPKPTKAQPKVQLSKSNAKTNQKTAANSKESGTRLGRSEVRQSTNKTGRQENVASRLVKPAAKESRAANRNQIDKPSAAELRAGRNKVQTSTAKKNQRAAEQRAAEARRAEARRQAEANRLAAIARQRAADQEMRDEVQAMISRDNTAGEDMEVRAAAVKALGNHAGTVVVMDPNTGRVYSMVNQEWAVRRGFKPCSTIKLVTGLAGLNEGVIDQSVMANVADSNHDNLTKALAYSKNEYFQQVGSRVGFETMISYSRQLGLGEKTGINSPNEFKGQVPSPRSGLSVNRIYSHGDDFTVTPLQLATLVSAMANGGKLLTPRIPQSAQEDFKLRPKVRRVLNIGGNTLASMIPGMVGAVNYGSGRKAHHSGASVAGKTGTCIEKGSWVGLFASYAPTVNPRLAVVVIGRGPDARGHFPAAVAGRIYRDLNGRFGTPTYLQVASHSSRNEKVDEEESLSGNDEELDEERSSYSINRAGKKTAAVQPRATESVEILDRSRNGSSNNKVKRVLMTIPQVSETPKKPAETKATQLQTRPRRVSQL